LAAGSAAGAQGAIRLCFNKKAIESMSIIKAVIVMASIVHALPLAIAAVSLYLVARFVDSLNFFVKQSASGVETGSFFPTRWVPGQRNG
jgi:hypothetical protein